MMNLFTEHIEIKPMKYGKLAILDMAMNSYEDRRRRKIRIWLPEDYDGVRRFPVLYMHDAQNLYDGFDDKPKWYINREMETLSRDGFSAIVVGVDNAPTRMSELCPDIPINPNMHSICHLPYERLIPTGDQYADFVTNQLKPYIDTAFMTLPDKPNTVVGGSSMGGLMSLYMLLKYPDIYGGAMVFSPNLVTHTQDEILYRLNTYDFTKLKENRVFIFHGGIGLEAANWPYVQMVFEFIRNKGLDEDHLALVYDSRQTHFETAWQKYFAEAFKFLFAFHPKTIPEEHQ